MENAKLTDEELEKLSNNKEELKELLNSLLENSNEKSRIMLAKQGYGLDVLVNDEDWCVREAVAEQGYGLDILITDEDEVVRAAVARQGYGLDRLVNDESEDVRQAAKEAQNTTKTEKHEITNI